MATEFDRWFLGAPVLHTGATGDFSVWYRGAPILQLQLSVTVEIVGAGGVELGGAADIEVVVAGQSAPLSGGVRIAGKRPTPKPRRQVVVVGSGGVEVDPDADVAVEVQHESRGGLELDGTAEIAVVVAWEPRGGVLVGGAAEIKPIVPSQRWWDRRVKEDEDLVLMEVL